MSVNIGVAIQRVENKLRRLYDANGDYPDLVAAFVDNYYRKANGNTTISQLINHSRAGNATMTDGYGPELVTNGSFAGGLTGWSDDSDGTGVIEYVDGAARIYHPDSTGTVRLNQDVGAVTGKMYEVSFNVVAGTTGNLQFRIGSSASQIESIAATTKGVIVRYMLAAGSELQFFRTYGLDVTIDNVSVREMPVIKWGPHNLFTYSEQFDNAAWTKTGTVTVTANASTAPDGSSTADRVVTSGASAITQSVIQELSHTIKVWVKAVTAGSNNTFRLQGTGGQLSSDLTATGDWQLFSFAPTILGTNGNWGINRDSSNNAMDLYVWGAHLHRSDLGGMADNPDRGDSYVPTAGRATGAELVTNGTFDNDISDWTETDTNNHVTPSYNNGKLRLTSTTNTSGAVWMGQTLSNLTVGQTHIVTADITITGTATASVILHNPYITSFPTITSSGRYHFTFKPTSTSHEIRALVNAGFTSGSTVDFDNISVRESSVDPSAAAYLPRVAHHVYNGDAWVNEGVLAESEARTNLIDYSDFSTGYTEGRTTLTADQAISPDGTENAAEVVETTDIGTHYVSTHTTVTASVDYTLSVYVKQGSGSRSAILRTNNEGSDGYVVFDFSSETITETGSAASNQTSQDVGNGWYRIAFTYTQSGDTSSGLVVGISNSTTPGASLPNYTGDGSSSLFIYGAQFEEASTPSSFIPTSGSSVTRAAETFTIPSANLPWPDPVYIGSELVTNGTFDTDTTGWTASNATLSVESGELKITSTGGNRPQANQTITTTVDRVYEISAIARTTSGSGDCEIEISGIGSGTSGRTSNTTNTRIFHVFRATASSHILQVKIDDAVSVAGDVVYFDNVSVREINPLSVSIAMDGRVTYADEDQNAGQIFINWTVDSNNLIQIYDDTRGTDTGQIRFNQSSSGIVDVVDSAIDAYSPGINVPFNIASRHGSTFINGAIDGVALTANTTPTALPDLSATDLSLAYDYMGTIKLFRIWNEDLGDDGIVAATNPSTEPSLNLTFDSTQASYVNFEWSE